MGPQNRTEVKGLLAKLLAGENITIVHEAIPTALFDLQERELHLPVWVDTISSSLYTMLEAHEVGHALETPNEGWQNAITYKCKLKHVHDETCADPNFAGYLNICEDARIERLIKTRYAGLKRHFLVGYKELYDGDFFGIKGVAVADLNLIDRINLQFKIGAHISVPFDAHEQTYVDRLDQIRTFEEVVEIAREIYKECKEKKQGIQNTSQLKACKTKAGGAQVKGSGRAGAPQAVTDVVFRETQNLLADKTTCHNAMLPEFNPQAVIYSLEEVVSFYENEVKADDYQYDNHANTILQRILAVHRDYINLLLQEFEMRKNATQYYRARQHRTGELDTRRLAHYQLTSDIFRRVTEVPKGKSHGIIMYLDMSSSMDGIYLTRAVEQAIILATFCQKARIPFDLYGFANSNVYGRSPKAKGRNSILVAEHRRDLEMNDTHFHLRHLLSSTSSLLLMRRAMRMLAYYFGQHGKNCNLDHTTNHVIRMNAPASTRGGLTTSGTPLCETIVLSRPMIEEFKARHRLDIVNVIYLTDGEGNPVDFPTLDLYSSRRPRAERFMIIDPKTKEFVYARFSEMGVQAALTQLVKQITGCRHIGYYICTDNLLDRLTERANLTSKQQQEAEKTIDTYAYAAVPMLGFDCYYYISTRLMGAPADDIEPGNLREVTEKFAKKLHRKKASRLILRQFAQQIATTDGLDDEYH